MGTTKIVSEKPVIGSSENQQPPIAGLFSNGSSLNKCLVAKKRQIGIQPVDIDPEKHPGIGNRKPGCFIYTGNNRKQKGDKKNRCRSSHFNSGTTFKL
jgi:hypothetical protein